MRIGILGTRGIPNMYGGYEQFTEHFAQYMSQQKHEVTVYSSSLHPYQKDNFNGVKLVHCYDPEDKLGTFGQFIYDYNCIRHSRKQGYDLLLLLGYTSSSVWGWMLPKAVIVSNMDGLEWKRTKYNWAVRRFLKVAEYLAVKTSDYFIADSKAIQSYLTKKYKIQSEFIAYGVHSSQDTDSKIFNDLHLEKGRYSMLIARMEPENNIETILDGVVLANTNDIFLVVGKAENKFGKRMQEKFKAYSNIRFVGPVYDLPALNYLRQHARYYFHGHSVGGTNPSLLEAMASGACICAHDNAFNRSVLANEAAYFQTKEDVVSCLQTPQDDFCEEWKNKNKQKVLINYSWEKINQSYERYLTACLKK